jgi:hypothetical protein
MLYLFVINIIYINNMLNIPNKWILALEISIITIILINAANTVMLIH